MRAVAEGVMTERSVLCVTAGTGALHRLAYTDRSAGNAGAPGDAERVVVCAHGLTRNGRDFDVLADRLAATRRVVCPDLPGRGRSSWLDVPGPDGGYALPQYLMDVVTLLARLDVEQVDWVGTSLGGIVGMTLASLPDTPVRRLVVNDIGPVVPAAFLAHIAGYVGTDPAFGSLSELEAYLRAVYPGFGELTDDQWHLLARNSVRPGTAAGPLRLAYDPAIARAFSPPHADQEFWPVWEAIRCPVLVLRGEHSPALTHEVAERMTRTGPRAHLVEIPGCGHAPALMAPDQIAVIEQWLDGGPG